jgi:WD40 repeat protein
MPRLCFFVSPEWGFFSWSLRHSSSRPRCRPVFRRQLDGIIKLFDIETAKEMHRLRVPDKIPTSFTFLYNGKELIVGTKEGELYSIDITTGQFSLLKDFGKREIVRLDAGKNSNIAVGLTGGSTFVYNIEKEKILSEYSATFLRPDFQESAISPAGTTVAVDEVNGKPRGCCLFNALTGEEIKLCFH